MLVALAAILIIGMAIVPAFASQTALFVRPGCVTPPSGMVGWWPGDDSATDVAGPDNGVVVNPALAGPAPVNPPYGPGIVEAAFFLDGTREIVLGNSYLLRFTAGFTLAAWVNPDPPPPPDDPGRSGIYSIITKWSDMYSEASYGFYLHNPDGQTRLLGFVGNGTSGNRGLSEVGLVHSGQWTAVAMTYNDTSGTIKLYAGGIPVGQMVQTGRLLASGATVVIGGQGAGNQRLFRGFLDEVQAFNRPLSDGEVQAIANAGSVGVCREDWSLNAFSAVLVGNLNYILSGGILAVAVAAVMVIRRRRSEGGGPVCPRHGRAAVWKKLRVNGHQVHGWACRVDGCNFEIIHPIDVEV